MTSGTAEGTYIPGPTHRLDEVKLLAYLKQHVQGFPNNVQTISVKQFSHGQSCPTYLLEVGGQRYVLRKKPPGKLLASAHAVEREYRVLAALHSTQVPVPRMLCLCEDAAVLGEPFYVMSFLQGRIHLDPALPDLRPEQRTAVCESLAMTLAALHSVKPADVGLQGYGRPSGYSRRQVWRWAGQYKASLLDGEAPLSEMLRLGEWLSAHIPLNDSDPNVSRVSHGDFRLDNVVMDEAQPGRVLGVLDWELSTLGDPLADLAYLCMPYHMPQGVPTLPTLPSPLPEGVLNEEQLVAKYAAARGIAPPDASALAFFLALSLFRLAAILAGVGARARQGNASSRIAHQVGAVEVVSSLAVRALEIVAQQSEDSLALGLPPAIFAGATAGPSGEDTAVSQTSDRGDGSHAQSPEEPSTSGFDPSPKAADIMRRVRAFVAEHVMPAEHVLERYHMDRTNPDRWKIHPLAEELKVKARVAGLWNLWMPAEMAHTLQPLVEATDEELDLGPGLSNLDYAHVCGAMGGHLLAPECFNSNAPDTGNMEVLAKYGTLEQQRRWLVPLLQGRIRSCFAMTEPDVASSDATNITSSIRRQGDEYVLHGKKWWTTGACDPRCAVAVFMGKSDTGAATYRQQSMILVPMNSPGVTVVRPLEVFGFDGAPHGHAEVHFRSVRVPVSNVLLGEGRGFEIAQGRLGPGRLHHCMRAIGLGERALKLMTRRALARTAFKKLIAEQGAFRKQLAECRIELDAARLVVLAAADALDKVGNKAARQQITAAKVYVPNVVLRILDAGMQVHGGAGLSADTPLAHLYAEARTLRLADGPDDVHLASIATAELKRVQAMSKL